MKLGNSFEKFFEDKKLGKLQDAEIYGKLITVDELHSFEMTDEETGELERKVVFITAISPNHYYYMPKRMADTITDDDIERINTGNDTIKGIFTKVTTKKGYQCWNFEDVE